MSNNDRSISTERRKAMVRQYKETPKIMGVYAIRNTISGRVYVAASRDIQARFNRHRMDLKTNSERAAALQLDWNAAGPDAFEFEILEQLEPLDDPFYNPAEDLEVLEQLWLEKLMPYGDAGYNVRPHTQ